jgi:hypothetical protein
MSNALKQYCNGVAKVAIYDAIELTKSLGTCRTNLGGAQFSETEGDEIFTAFSFMNLMVSIGVWSNLTDERIRIDLNTMTKNDVIVGMSHFLNRGKASESAIVATFAKIQIDLLPAFGTFWKRQFYALVKEGNEPDSRLTLIATMDWINRDVPVVGSKAITDFVPGALALIQKVENIASEMIKAQDG